MIVRKISEEGLELIKRWEGFSPTMYYCPARYPTIGYGHVVLPSEMDELGEGITINEDQAGELLRRDVKIAERSVTRLIGVLLTDGQYAALVSFTYNLGGGALQRSTLRAKLNRGEYLEAAEEFPKWVWAGGRKLRGLVLRRQAEMEMFLSPSGD